jgi:hypothetical protein
MLCDKLFLSFFLLFIQPIDLGFFTNFFLSSSVITLDDITGKNWYRTVLGGSGLLSSRSYE